MRLEDGVDPERLEQAKRLNWIIGWEIFDPKSQTHRDIMREFDTPALYWEAVTPGIKQMSLDKLSYILDGDKEVLDQPPEHNVTEEDWAAHRAVHGESSSESPDMESPQDGTH